MDKKAKIIDYLINVRGKTPVVANLLQKKLSKYEDIEEKFCLWLDNSEHDKTLVIEGYSAEDISRLADHFDGPAVYCFLVTLRDDPEGAKELIKKGFPRK